MLVEIMIRGQAYYYQAELAPAELKRDYFSGIKKHFETAEAAEALMANMPVVQPAEGTVLIPYTPGNTLLYTLSRGALASLPKLDWLGSDLSARILRTCPRSMFAVLVNWHNHSIEIVRLQLYSSIMQ
jgi:hypothetical protein